MIQIHNVLAKEEGAPVAPFTMYTQNSKGIFIQGKTKFHVFGNVLVEKVKLTSGHYEFDLLLKTQVTVGQGSAIVFTNIQPMARTIPEAITVPEVPEFHDATTQLIRAAIAQYMQEHNLKRPLVEDEDQDIDDEQDFELDDDDDFPIDTYSLIEEQISQDENIDIDQSEPELSKNRAALNEREDEIQNLDENQEDTPSERDDV